LFVPDGSFPFVPPRARPAVGGRVIEFGRRYHEVVETVRISSRELGVKMVGFSELTIEEVARELGVPIVEAQLAKLREYTELFRFVDEPDSTRSRLMKALRRRGLRCWRVGTHYLAGATQDRAESLDALKAMWAQAWGDPLVIGFGDSEDDVAWLRQANIAVFVQNDRCGVPARVLSKLPTVQVTRSPGRAGWSEAIFEFVGSLMNERQQTAVTNRLVSAFEARADGRSP
jgi:predicted mannosyl-3-phosphoglycerate phosphatase (HAD superfamily)